jgi:hypothetical protein
VTRKGVRVRRQATRCKALSDVSLCLIAEITKELDAAKVFAAAGDVQAMEAAAARADALLADVAVLARHAEALALQLQTVH